MSPTNMALYSCVFRFFLRDGSGWVTPICKAEEFAILSVIALYSWEGGGAGVTSRVVVFVALVAVVVDDVVIAAAAPVVVVFEDCEGGREEGGGRMGTGRWRRRKEEGGGCIGPSSASRSACPPEPISTNRPS